MKKFIIRWFEFDLSQVKWGRKYIGGKWYRMRTGLPMGDIWSRKPFTSCQAYVVEEEDYGT